MTYTKYNDYVTIYIYPNNDNVIFSYSTCAIAFPTSLKFSSFKTETFNHVTTA